MVKGWQKKLKYRLKKVRFRLMLLKNRLVRPYRAIRASGLFDEAYYLAKNPDTRNEFIDPLAHYLEHGHGEGRNPNPLFETGWYWLAYPEVAKKRTNPLADYVLQGWRLGRNPSPMFESLYYAAATPGLRASGENPLAHYLRVGAWNGRYPNPLFDSAYYLAQNPDVAHSGENPLAHYSRLGFWQGRPTKETEESFAWAPKISLLTPVYNVAAPYLQACVDSVLAQGYQNWELCLADDASSADHIRPMLEGFCRLDPRIRAVFLEENRGIAGATNAAAALATGEYLAFLDNDDELTRDALAEVVRTLNRERADIVYSDECLVDAEGNYLDSHHKPDFSPDLLLCHNYITHLLVLRKTLWERIGGVGQEFDGAQDYDLILKATEQTERIAHIPRILYRWRTIATSTSYAPGAKSYAEEAGRRALAAAMRRRQGEAEVLPANLPFYYRVRRKLRHTPLVSILIPFKDHPEFLATCISSICSKSSYQNYEIIGISNNSQEPRTFALMRQLAAEESRLRFVEHNIPFNYSAINNFAVGQSRGEQLVLLNNDIEIISPDWLEAMLEHSQRPEVAVVGAKLYYPDDTVQHAGVIIGIGGFAGHSHRLVDRHSPGYFNRLCCIQNVSAVTGALCMVKRSLYEMVGGLDEEHFGVALNDVDFCLKLMARGYRNIFTPYAEAYHHESVSRGYEDTRQKKNRFQREVLFFQEKWRQLLDRGDPFYNPNLTLIRENFARNRFVSWYRSPEERTMHLVAAKNDAPESEEP
jgi:O-antigen biosynthesis protein